MELCEGLLLPASEGRQQGCFSHFWGVSLAASSLLQCTATPSIQTLPHCDGQRCLSMAAKVLGQAGENWLLN